MADLYKDDDNEENVYVTDDTVLNQKTKSIPTPKERTDTDTEGEFIKNIAQAAISSRLDMSSINEFSTVSQTRDQIYDLLDGMCEDSTIAAILETYAEDATEYNESGDIVWAESDDSNVAKFVKYLLDTMQVNKYAYDWVYALCKYGDLYLQLYKESEFNDDKFFNKDNKKQLNEDIKVKAYKDDDTFVHYLEAVPNPAEMFELTRFGKTIGYIKANIKNSSFKKDNLINFTYRYKFKQSDIFIYDATKFVHASLSDGVDRHTEEVSLFLDSENVDADQGVTYQVKKGQSLLYNTFKIWRELSLLENSMLLNRITKSSIVRLINVEIGDMPKEQVGPHLQGIKQLLEQKSAINEGNSISEYTNPGPIENNIYVPINNGKGAITADQIGGDVNISQIPDIEYFQNKFFGSMRIPKQYFGLTDDGAGFNGGESLAIISSRYAKMVKRIQNALIQAITSAINLMLIDKGLSTYIGKFTIKMQPPTTQEEIDRRENISSKIQIAGDIMNLVSDIDSIPQKLKILKSLLSNIINDPDVFAIIDEEIKKLEEQEKAGGDVTSEDNGGDLSLGGSGADNEPLNLDSELGLNDFGSEGEDNFNLDNESETGTEEGESLPTPEELGIDATSFEEEPAGNEAQ